MKEQVNMFSETFWININRWLQKHNKDIRWLAQTSGLNEQSIKVMKKHQEDPISVEVLIRITSALKASPKDLIMCTNFVEYEDDLNRDAKKVRREEKYVPAARTEGENKHRDIIEKYLSELTNFQWESIVRHAVSYLKESDDILLNMTRKACAETHTSDDPTETKIRDMWKRIKYAVDKKGQMKNFESITKIKESVLYDNILKLNAQDADFTDLMVDEMYRISEYFGVNLNYFVTDYYDKKEEEENSAYPMYSQMHKIMSWLTPEQQENVRSHITSYL